MNEEMEYQLKNLLKNNQPQDYIEIIEKENEEYIEIINNLQSKIDKANEILNRPQFEYDNIPCNYEEDIKELKDVLKEDE